MLLGRDALAALALSMADEPDDAAAESALDDADGDTVSLPIDGAELQMAIDFMYGEEPALGELLAVAPDPTGRDAKDDRRRYRTATLTFAKSCRVRSGVRRQR